MPNTRKVLSKAIMTIDSAYKKGVVRGRDKAIKVHDSSYSRYEMAIMDEDYNIASRLFRQAEQDDDLTDKEVDKLLSAFKSKFGKNPK